MYIIVETLKACLCIMSNLFLNGKPTNSLSFVHLVVFDFLKNYVYMYWKWITFTIINYALPSNISLKTYLGGEKKWEILSDCHGPFGEESAGPKSLQCSFLASDFIDIPATEKVLKTIVRTHNTNYGTFHLLVILVIDYFTSSVFLKLDY